MEQTTKITKIKSHKAGARTNMNKLQFAAWRKCKQCKSEKRKKHKHLRSPSGFGSGLSAPTINISHREQDGNGWHKYCNYWKSRSLVHQIVSREQFVIGEPVWSANLTS